MNETTGIQILFFAGLREKLGTSGEVLAGVPEPLTVSDLRAQLVARGGKWLALNDQSLLVAINQELAGSQSAVAAGDEVAFFPPVTGG